MIRRWWGWGQWFVIPLAVFVFTEVILRNTFDRFPTWYGAAQWAASDARVDVVFIGSSRTAAAVNVESFATDVFAITGRCPRGLNLGRPYSTDAEHYLGLRNLFTSHPESLQGVTVFVEAPGGLPSNNGSGLPTLERWRTSWVHSMQPWLVVDVLRTKDLLPFWRSQELVISDKVHLTFRFALRKISSTLNRRERIREELLEDGIAWLLHLTNGRIRPNPFTYVPVHYGLASGGGIRTDPASLQVARKAALRFTDQSLKNEKPLREWDTAVLSDLVQLVRQHGGQVVFFEMPLSSTFARLYATPMRQEDIRIFREHARAWGTPMIRAQLSFAGEDFPDLWHVGPSLAPTFTAELAKAWVETLRAKGQSPGGSELPCRP